MTAHQLCKEADGKTSMNMHAYNPHFPVAYQTTILDFFCIAQQTTAVPCRAQHSTYLGRYCVSLSRDDTATMPSRYLVLAGDGLSSLFIMYHVFPRLGLLANVRTRLLANRNSALVRCSLDSLVSIGQHG